MIKAKLTQDQNDRFVVEVQSERLNDQIREQIKNLPWHFRRFFGNPYLEASTISESFSVTFLSSDLKAVIRGIEWLFPDIVVEGL